MSSELISQAEYARRRGVSRNNINKLVKAGKLPSKDGKIDPVKADEAYEKILNPAARFAGQQGGTADKDKSGGENFAKIRTAEKMIELQLKKEKLERVRQTSIDRATVEGTVFALARATRDAWRSWPAKVAPLLAAELGVDSAVLRTKLEKYVRSHLAELSDPPLQFTPRR